MDRLVVDESVEPLGEGAAVDEGTGSGLWQTAGGCGFVESVADGRGGVVSQVGAEGGVVDVSEGRFEPVG
jgi:hypothetical protein